MIKVAIYEDNQSLRLGLYHLVNGTEGYTCVGAFQDCAHLMQNIRDTAPDVILMDIGMPGLSGIEAVRILRKEYPLLKILMQTIFEDTDKIFESILAGASGYILKNTSPSRILDYIKETYEGGAPMSPSVAVKVLKMVGQPVSKEAIDKFNLTEREKEILACLIKGMSYRMIAESCFISVDTVRGHIRSIYEKLHVHSKGEAVAKAIKGNIL